METNLKNLALKWLVAEPEKAQIASEYYCQTRDVFEARNNKVPDELIQKGMDDDLAYLIYSMLGEIGNNSFDHNLANWPNIPGVFFAVEYDGKIGRAIIADRGLGVLNTLRKAVPDLENDEEALELAFTKKISSRVFENRGNGLKFVKNNIAANNLLLEFSSGDAQVVINHNMNKNKLENRVDGCLVILNF
ncbi:MAG: hypothetical protein UT50_C0010G0001 [Candidatus Moranbacteria bacterium GW2011_GWA2_39_41]|nr:MAG: hypothetical protein UT50_C0010G0001 [Candidatus Moranbacteria bacterium GW2011_GWA2_39_41]